MEIKKKIRLAYRIEEKPGGGYVARSDDPTQEPIEAASKLELFQKMRERTADLLGHEIPLDLGHLDIEAKQAGHGAVIDIATKQPPDPKPDLYAMIGSKPLAAGSRTGSSFWKIAFFLLLGIMLAWYFLHR